MLATFLEAKSSTLKNIAGVPVGSTQFVDYLNDGTRRLMRRGDWSGTIVPIRVCIRKGCVVWPRYVGQVRKITVCNMSTPISNIWYDFLDTKTFGCCWSGWANSYCRMVQEGQTPTFNSIFGDNRYVRAYTQAQADVGKTVTIFGIDNNNQPLRTNNPDNSWSDGVKLTLVGAPNNYAQTTMFVRRIDRVLKDVTQGPVLLYGFDSINNVLEDLARYEPSETNPSYVRSQLHLCNCDCSKVYSVLALVKLRFIPVVVDTDLVLIECLDALKDYIQSLKFREAGNVTEANEFEKSAVRELNLELRDDMPEDQMPVSVEPFSGLNIGQQQCF